MNHDQIPSAGQRGYRIIVPAMTMVLCLGFATGAVKAQTTRPDTPAAAARPVEIPAIYDSVTTRFTGAQIRAWEKVTVDGQECWISPVMDFGSGYEINHHRIAAVYSGSGSVEVSLAHSTRPVRGKVIHKSYLRGKFAPLKNKAVMKVVSTQKRERYAWLLVRTVGQVNIKALGHVCWRGKATIYGHVARHFDFASSKLQYRLMYPRNYDPRKKYPLVLSVSGSGGVGMDNVKNMEMIIFARYLFMRYYYDKEFECFSIVPQIPPSRGQIPAPYFPKGPKGAPTKFHPTWPAVNENGWYTQATLALISSLIKDKSISIDPDRIYFSGYSYGGKACWEFLRAGRDVFAAGASGGGWPIGRAGSDPDAVMLRRLKLEVQRHKHIPVYIFAGGTDAMRFGSAAIHKEILAQGGTSYYDKIAGANHIGAAGRGWTNRKRIEWLFQQRRDKNPAAGQDPFPGGVYK